MSSLLDYIADPTVLSSPLAVVPFLLVSAFVLVGCGKSRPPPKAAGKGGKKPGDKSLKGSSKSNKSKRGLSSKSAKGKSAKSSKKSSKSKRAKLASAKPGPLPGAAGAPMAYKEPVVIRAPKAGPAAAPPAPRAPGAPGAKQSSAEKSAEGLRTAESLSKDSVHTGRDMNDSKKLELQPEHLKWSPSGGMQSVTIVNNTGERQAIKVKCSDNLLYRVNPVYAFVDEGQKLKVDVLRQNGSAKIDKLVLLTAKATPTDQKPQQLFKAGSQNPMMVVPLLATPAAAA
ncbi:MSP-domain protein 4 [Aphelenchoides avenae]|nr:MSP-domain protein 4 [Aphelenchus avenae]